jgi:xanthine dehydrogenase accessory factor
MNDTFDQLERLRMSGGRAALATLVATRGTSPRKEGATMWVAEDGTVIGSVTIGGCVDARVLEAAEATLGTSASRLLSMDLGEEDARALGLTCAGAIDVVVRPIDAGDDSDVLAAAYERIRARIDQGGSGVLIMRLPDPGDATADAGALVVLDDGTTAGTLGGAELDAAAAARASEQLRLGASRTVRLAAAGSETDAFFEVLGRGPALIVFGGGNVAVPLVEMARTLAMHVLVVEARERFGGTDRFPGAHEVLVGVPSEIAESLSYDPATAVVMVTHDYKWDLPVLKKVLETDAGYVGMLGSRRRGEGILAMLAEDGVEAEQIARVHTPVGLDIGASSAQEIALSILAEIVAVRNGRGGGSMRAVAR